MRNKYLIKVSLETLGGLKPNYESTNVEISTEVKMFTKVFDLGHQFLYKRDYDRLIREVGKKLNLVIYQKKAHYFEDDIMVDSLLVGGDKVIMAKLDALLNLIWGIEKEVHEKRRANKIQSMYARRKGQDKLYDIASLIRNQIIDKCIQKLTTPLDLPLGWYSNKNRKAIRREIYIALGYKHKLNSYRKIYGKLN
jgi:hypothetical protein